MPYESLRAELEHRLGRKAEFRNQEETLDFRTENWSGKKGGKLAKALAKARERAKQVRKPLKIERLDAESFQAEMDCPPATQDVAINTKNRNATIKNFDYGPLNVDEPGDYWKKIAKRWKTTEKAAKKSKCGNCVAFDRSPRMKACMPGETSDGEGVLGYCWMHHFKCHSARTCDTWAKGGPITTDKVSEGWQERAFGGSKASKAAKKGGKEKAKAAESKDEAIVVEGYRPKRVEAWNSAGNVAIFYVGDMAERVYTMRDATTPRTERELLGFTTPRSSGSSIINPTGITLADVDELMQYSTGEPWNGKYVLYTFEGIFINGYEPKTFQSEPAIAVKCFECERPGYSDEMSRFALGYLCARCSRPEIDWSRYDAEGMPIEHDNLTGAIQEFNAPRRKSYYKPSELRERAIEVMKTHDGWMGKEELVAKINADLPARRKTTSFNVSRALGAGRGGVEPFYVTTDGRIYYYGDQDRGEFIKGVI
tara:strand:- start:5575 stop:7020 length:1446 start_codon:yes stop_codon:yes gene_type:complete